MARRARIALTIGDPGGIGPELVCRAAAHPDVRAACEVVAVGSRAVFETVGARLGLACPERIADVTPAGCDPTGIEPGRPQRTGGALAAAAVEHAVRGCLDGHYAAMVTAPISKLAIRAAGVPFPGHTEWLAERCGVVRPTMMLWSEELAVALVTCHRALASVPGALSVDAIVTTGRRLAAALRDLGIAEPRIGVLGLNPHAGEDGLFGEEERETIAPACRRLAAEGLAVTEPLPPDTAFVPARRAEIDGYVAMYHDQGLIPIKALAFDSAVNVTLGLPIVRTSPDHGTAYDIAWQGRADPGSMIAAVQLAIRLAETRLSSR
ncbi:MAG: 4-hydroxythreonine-4-phosphate dehydrogenase PdxA [Acidobacteriota bacterium]